MMTREEAIEIFEQKGWWIAQKETLTSKQAEEIIKLNDAVNFVLTTLRPVSREQVEKVWRGEWEHPGYYDDGGSFVHDCSKCNTPSTDEYWFCPFCGAPMTDEAVGMMLERWKEAFNNA